MTCLTPVGSLQGHSMVFDMSCSFDQWKNNFIEETKVYNLVKERYGV